MDRKEWSERKAKLDAEMMDHPFLKEFTRAQRAEAEKKKTLSQLADYGRHSKKEREKMAVPVIPGFTRDQVKDYWTKRQDFLNRLMERQGLQRMIRQAILQDWVRMSRSSLKEEETADPEAPGQEDEAETAALAAAGREDETETAALAADPGREDETETAALAADPGREDETEKTARAAASGQEEQDEKSWFRVVLGDAKDYLPLTDKTKWNAFDGVSYMDAVWETIRSYDAGYQNEGKETKASFINLLASCYAHQMDHSQKEQVNIASSHAYALTKDISHLLGVISDYLKEKKTGCSLEELTREDELYEQVIQYAAKATKRKPDTVRNLMPILQKIRTESLDTPAGSEGEGKIQDVLPDAATLENMTQDKLEKQDLAFRFLQAVSKKQMQEYNRLLMTNLILVPIHPAAGPREDVRGKKEYTDLLKQNSAGLYKMVFHLPYLEYIGWRKPKFPKRKANPARIEVLCDGYPLKDLNAKSIAAYKEVTPANVTYYSSRFAGYLKEIAEQDLGITD